MEDRLVNPFKKSHLFSPANLACVLFGVVISSAWGETGLSIKSYLSPVPIGLKRNLDVLSGLPDEVGRLVEISLYGTSSKTSTPFFLTGESNTRYELSFRGNLAFDNDRLNVMNPREGVLTEVLAQKNLGSRRLTIPHLLSSPARTSPDGKYTAISGFADPGSFKNTGLWLLRRSDFWRDSQRGMAETIDRYFVRVSHDNVKNQAWSRDSEHIAYVSASTGKADINVYHLESKSFQRVGSFSSDSGYGRVEWLGTNALLFVPSFGRKGFVHIDLVSSKKTSYPRRFDDQDSLSVSPDGKWAATWKNLDDNGQFDVSSLRLVRFSDQKEFTMLGISRLRFSADGDWALLSLSAVPARGDAKPFRIVRWSEVVKQAVSGTIDYRKLAYIESGRQIAAYHLPPNELIGKHFKIGSLSYRQGLLNSLVASLPVKNLSKYYFQLDNVASAKCQLRKLTGEMVAESSPTTKPRAAKILIPPGQTVWFPCELSTPAGTADRTFTLQLQPVGYEYLGTTQEIVLKAN